MTDKLIVPAESAVRAESKLTFMTAVEIANEVPEHVDWIVRPWVAAGAITELDGKVKVAGKTTLVTHMCKAVLDGQPFMDEPTQKGPIVYLSEQPKRTFRETLRRAGLLDQGDLHVLFWDKDIAARKWAFVMERAVNRAKEVGAKLIVVDTIAQFAGFEGDKENNSGDALAAAKPLQYAAQEGLGVLVVRHEGKRGGSAGDSGRGSSAFSGAVDVVMSLKRPDGQGNPHTRKIESVSRFDDTPDQLVIELTDDGYVSHGTSSSSAAEKAALAILQGLPDRQLDAWSMDELLQNLDVSRTAAQEALKRMQSRGEVDVIGDGKKGSPFKYFKLPILSATTTTTEAENIQ